MVQQGGHRSPPSTAMFNNTGLLSWLHGTSAKRVLPCAIALTQGFHNS
jgi:hypothetical protein